jgi:hypothetical protein
MREKRKEMVSFCDKMVAKAGRMILKFELSIYPNIHLSKMDNIPKSAYADKRGQPMDKLL